MNAPAGRGLKQRALGAGLEVLRASGVARMAAPVTRGLGAFLMFHHVRPWPGHGFAPNRGLEITPEFLEETIRATRAAGYEILPIDAAVERIRDGHSPKPFAVLTFDDGYRDNFHHALPVLKRHDAPFTLFVTTGYAERTAPMWWTRLEASFRALDRIEAVVEGQKLDLPAATDAEKADAFKRLYWRLRAAPEARLHAVVDDLAARAGVDNARLCADLCMDWDELATMAREPLCTIGAHSLTHPMLAKHDEGFARREMGESKSIIEDKLGCPVRHFAYPVGDPTSAGPREFGLARELGFVSAVTTRKGMVFPEHAAHLTALPRLSINGDFQTRAALDALLTGAPFWLMNFGRKLDVS